MDVIKVCTCGVCLELFTDPRMLPCGHTYCQKCIEPLLEGAKQKSALCPEFRSKNKQPAKGFPVNYGMLSMVGTVEASAGTRRIGTCISCAKGASMTDLYSCATCKENSATAADAEFLVCGRCIAKTHKGHDYQELDVLSKKDIDKALQKVQACRDACGAKKVVFHNNKGDLVAAVEHFDDLLAKHEHALDTIAGDLRSGNALTKPQLLDKVNESETIKKELREGKFAEASAAMEECYRKLRQISSPPQANTGAPDADASVLVVEHSSDDLAPPPARRRRVLTPARRGITRMAPNLLAVRRYEHLPQASTSGSRQALLAAATAPVPEASVVTVEDDEAAAASPSQRRRSVRQSMSRMI
ncbi:Tripartite motif-containing protein 13 [Aphelenchoides avenae]|nr:Tripartite motif-containing protein 13 [Aphelenchus avenae]